MGRVIGLLVGPTAGTKREHHVLRCREFGDQIVVLKDDPNFLQSEFRTLSFAEGRQLSTGHVDVTGGRRDQSTDNVEKRCFTGSARPEQRDIFARFN